MFIILNSLIGVADAEMEKKDNTFNYLNETAVILLSSADSFKKGCCQLQAKVCAQITG